MKYSFLVSDMNSTDSDFLNLNNNSISINSTLENGYETNGITVQLINFLKIIFI